jgi:hypothetical protein
MSGSGSPIGKASGSFVIALMRFVMAKKKVSRKNTAVPSRGTKKKASQKKGPVANASNDSQATRKSVSKKKAASNAATERQKRRSHFGEFPTENVVLRARVLPVSKETAYARARIAMLHEMDNLRRRPGFLFADVGYKFTEGVRTDFVAVRIHVTRKISEGKCLDLTCYNDLVPTDVIVSNFQTAVSLNAAGALIRSDGNPGGFGTLGMGVQLNHIGKPFFLTCAHVVSKSQPPSEMQNFVMDADGNDIGLSSNHSDSFFRFDGNFDLALLLPHDSISLDDMGRFAASLPTGVQSPSYVGDVTSADLNRVVFKIGANQPRISKGFIDSVETSPIPIRESPDAIDHFLVRSASVVGQHANSGNGFANQGDSGSIVFAEDGRILGMVRAVYDDNNDNEGDRAVVTRMKHIQDEFGIGVLG